MYSNIYFCEKKYMYKHNFLLLILKKGLEQIIIKRLTWLTIKYKVLLKFYFYVILLKFIVDYIILLINKIE